MSDEERTLRDQFASAALPAIIRFGLSHGEIKYTDAAVAAYGFADAMLAERAKATGADR